MNATTARRAQSNPPLRVIQVGKIGSMIREWIMWGGSCRDFWVENEDCSLGIPSTSGCTFVLSCVRNCLLLSTAFHQNDRTSESKHSR